VRYLVLSDIHANLGALEAVLEAHPRSSYDALIVLGDLVGYGPDPNEVTDRIRDLHPDVIIRGNHDKVAAGLEDASAFNNVAREAALWTRDALSPANRDYLAALPEGPLRVGEWIEICHGSPFDEDAYVFDDVDALRAIRTADRQVCLFGHTHVPLVFLLTDTRLDAMQPRGPEHRVRFDPGIRYLVNAGSVGQPRDGDARAACGVIDTDAHEMLVQRVEYSIEPVQGRITKAGLPEPLAFRLGLGR
jgi:predicted phosphodiesterase